MVQFDGFIEGRPIQQGSLSPFPYRKHNGKLGISVFQRRPLIDWRNKIADYIRDKYQLDEVPFKKGTAVHIELTFSFVRPKSVSQKKRPDMTVYPDLDKCIRAVGDAIAGVLYDDDSQVVSILAKKTYADEEGVYFKVTD